MVPTKRPPRPRRFSHTFLDLYQSCAAAAAAKLRGEPAVVPPPVASGSCLHQGIARYGGGCWERRVAKDLELMAHIAAGYDPQTRRSLEAFAADARWPWRKMPQTAEGECPVEQYLEAKLPNGETWCGVIDLLLVEKGAGKGNPFADGPDVLRVVDWKQGRPAHWFEKDPPDQLLGYAVLWRLLHPEQHDYELLYGAPGWQGKWEFRAWSVGRVEVDAHERYLCGMAERILADERWEARPGEACARCFYQAACPKRGTETFAVLTGLEADELAAADAWHVAKHAEAVGHLQALVKAGGARAGAAGWGWNVSRRLEPRGDAEAVDEALRARGHSASELQTEPAWDQRRIAKALKEGWLAAEELEEVSGRRSFGPEKTTTAPPGDPGAGGEKDGDDLR